MRTWSLVDIELERAWHNRTTWTIGGAMLAVGALVAWGATHAAPEVAAATEVRDALSGMAALRVFVVLLGVLAVTSQYHHGDIVWRYLADPSRRYFVATKAIACAVVGTFLGLAAVQLAAVLAVVDIGPGAGLGLTAGALGQAVGGTVAVMALAGVLGVGVGAAVRTQTPAVVGVLVAFLVVEPVIGAVAPAVGAVLPGAAAAAAAGGTATIGWSTGLALTVAYTAAAVVAGTALCGREDI